jgi:hypothetical protein
LSSSRHSQTLPALVLVDTMLAMIDDEELWSVPEEREG